MDADLNLAEIPDESGVIRFRYMRYMAPDGSRWIRHGLFVAYHDNGSVSSEGSYVHGAENGVWREFHPNGQLAAEGSYLDGQETGAWRFWSPDGAEQSSPPKDKTPSMSQLSWEDLFTDASHLDFERLLAQWPGLVTGSVRPIGASAFGDLFFERQSGGVEKLDVLEGGVHEVATSFEEFSKLMNSPDWQQAQLLSNGVALLKDKGVAKTQAQFFAFAPHPSLVGRIEWSSVLPLDAVVWHSICAQALGSAPVETRPSEVASRKKPWWKAW